MQIFWAMEAVCLVKNEKALPTRMCDLVNYITKKEQ